MSTSESWQKYWTVSHHCLYGGEVLVWSMGWEKDLEICRKSIQEKVD